MPQGRYVAYFRVSTQRQGTSGLGLESQRGSVLDHVARDGGELVGEFTEVESAWKGKAAYSLDKRPQLKAALDLCRKERATLLIAVLDRLARNVRFIAELMENGVPFVSLEMPKASPFELHIRAAVAEEESRKISERTRAAMKVAKDRGTLFGVAGTDNLRSVNDRRVAAANDYANRMRGMLLAYKARGLSLRAIVDELNAHNIPTPRGGTSRWHLPTLQRLLVKLAPERNVRELVDELQREGWHTVESITAELQRRGVFDQGGQPHTARDVKLMMRRAA